jgi:UDP-N-acetylmuramoyl-tripeptide--D-alanyl-D-alanine ligase
VTSRFAWTDLEVRRALGIDSRAGSAALTFDRISTDTRAVIPGDLFVALRGETFDGHDFVAEARARGARGAVVSKPVPAEAGFAVYEVGDTLRALGGLAAHRRRSLPAQVVGVTGSSGKTTVKELLSAALSATFSVYSTRGNLNNRVGLPLSLLAAPEAAEFLVLELGTSEPGEIRALTAIAEPDHAVVTTVSEAHLSGLESLEGVLTEKLDLVRGASPTGKAIVGEEPAILAETARGIRPDVRVAGLSERADSELRGELVGQGPDGRYTVRVRGREARPGVPGRHGARNFVLATSVAWLLGADDAAALERASAVKPGPLRGEVRRIGGLTMILDCYNANPQSVAAALDLLAELPGATRRVAVLGSMLELGTRAGELHDRVLRRALTLPLDLVVASGEFAVAARAAEGRRHGAVGTAARAPDLIAEPAVNEAYEALRPRLSGNETVLLKASRGVALERLLERFEADFGGGG